MVLSRWIAPGCCGSVAVLLLLCSTGPAWGQSSTHYAVERQVLSNSGERSTSASFVVTTTLSELVTGASSNDNAILQSGFWSFSGSLGIPRVLAVKRNFFEPQHCDLHWSGNDRRYDVFAGSCNDVFDSFYATTGANVLWNVDPPDQPLTCFIVVPAAFAKSPPARGTTVSKEH
jgi:hypothetical protein